MSKLAWEKINWTLVQKRLSRQQRRVYKASMEGKRQTVRALQHRILGSLDAKFLSVRRVTTKNQRRSTFSINGMKVFSNKKKIELAYGLKLDGKSKYIRRIYIPRIGKIKKRFLPVSPSTIEDRAKQMLAKLALEPEWEAVFEHNSYGFRPGRSCHDAIASLFFSLRRKNLYVLNTNIHKCLDKINHDKFIIKLDTFDQIENQIKAWLKANIMVRFENESNEVTKALEETCTCQGEIISPLLANIALHGLENHIKDKYSNYGYINSKGKKDRKRAIGFSRYADNFIITAPNYTDIVKIEKLVDKWLIKETGLKLSKGKPRVFNSTSGFEFLGFQIISIRTVQNEEYKIKVRPSKKSKTQIIQCTRKIIQENKSASSYKLITLLSIRIISWAKYFCLGECQKDFSKIDFIIFKQIRAWVFRRKSKGLRSRKKLKENYFPSKNIYIFRGNQYQNNWILTGKTLDKEGEVKQNFLPKMSWVNSTQHIKVKGNASPYDCNYLYWAKRTYKYLGLSNKVCKLIKIQNGCCRVCGLPFTQIDDIEVDYIIPQLKRGPDKFSNLQVLHKHCYIQKSKINKAVAIFNDFDVSQIIKKLTSLKGF